MQKKNFQSLSYLKIFLLVVFIAALISISYKVLLMFENSSFRYDSFNVLVVGRDVSLIHIDKGSEKLYVLTFEDKGGLFRNKSKISASLLLKVSVDGLIYERNPGKKVTESFPTLKAVSSIFLSPNDFILSDINGVDLLKLLYYSLKIEKLDRIEKQLKEINTEENGLTDLFLDRQIFNEKVSIEIINGTEIDGFGGKIGGLLKRAGYNIVAVDTENHSDSKILTADDRKITVKKLSRFFNSKITAKKDQGIADVTLIIGKDIIRKLN